MASSLSLFSVMFSCRHFQLNRSSAKHEMIHGQFPLCKPSWHIHDTSRILRTFSCLLFLDLELRGPDPILLHALRLLAWSTPVICELFNDVILSKDSNDTLTSQLPKLDSQRLHILVCWDIESSPWNVMMIRLTLDLCVIHSADPAFTGDGIHISFLSFAMPFGLIALVSFLGCLAGLLALAGIPIVRSILFLRPL